MNRSAPDARNGIDVLVVGDANPDLVLTGDVVPRFGQAEQLLDSADLVLGGSAAIVAAGLARLGARTALAAVVGADRFGAFVRECLDERGVDSSPLDVRRDVGTGLTVVLSDENDRAILTRLGTIPFLRAAAVVDAVDDLHPKHVHIASYFLQPQLAGELVPLVDRLASDGITVSLDTNWDPAERWEGIDVLLGRITYLLPNVEEAIALARAVEGRPVETLDEAGVVLSSRGCRVVVKAGAAGGISYDRGKRVTAAAGLMLDVVDTTGAGDSFDAGYIAAASRGIDDEAERLRWAAVAGSLSVRALGGTGAQASLEEMHEHVAV